MRLLDLFCGAGGAAMGYFRAGFTEIVGIDIKPQPRYPFRFIQGDALRPPVRLEEFDAIHASPPCQAHTAMSNRWRGSGGRADEHVSLVEATRALIQRLPYVIENVPGAPLRAPITRLRGSHFNLGVDRLRLFETSFIVLAPEMRGRLVNAIGVYGQKPDGRRLWTRRDGSIQRAAASLKKGHAAMGIDWMEWRELAESIPPAYTEFIGKQLIAALERRTDERSGR
jgi:DNA (cytosine-5)-methyltransferase 1